MLVKDLKKYLRELPKKFDEYDIDKFEYSYIYGNLEHVDTEVEENGVVKNRIYFRGTHDRKN